MSKEKIQNEDLNKSIDLLIEDIFGEKEVASEEVEKSIDIAKDAQTKADQAVAQAPKAQKDEARGAGRPKQISDVPQEDEDGQREKKYDAAITENEGKEDEPEETKKQIKAIDQVSKEGHQSGQSKAPASRPFKKSENGEIVEISEEEYKAFQEFKKSQVEAAVQAKEAEELKKAETAKKEQEDLLKSVVKSATEELRKSMEDLKKTNEEQAAIIKSMAKQPVRAKSIIGIEQLEKSVDPDNSAPESFSKSDLLDAAEALFKAGKISDNDVVELEMTGRMVNPESRAQVEKYLEGKN